MSIAARRATPPAITRPATRRLMLQQMPAQMRRLSTAKKTNSKLLLFLLRAAIKLRPFSLDCGNSKSLSSPQPGAPLCHKQPHSFILASFAYVDGAWLIDGCMVGAQELSL